jgi:glycosyltransferase involved in cell wall biosynthesis
LGEGPAGIVGGMPNATTDVEIVIPVYNEAVGLDGSIRRLHAYLHDHVPYSWRITIADNASTDDTMVVAMRLAGELHHVHALHLARKGRGRALRAAWLASASPVVAYMDVDLSTHLHALTPMVAPLLRGEADVAIGSRLARGAHVKRGPKREIISRGYNFMLRVAMHASFSDAQCGFKAARRDAVEALLPLVEDDDWFFDTELLLVAQHNDMRIHEVPVRWVDDPDSRVDIWATIKADLAGMRRMHQRFARGEARVGVSHRTRPTVRPAVFADAT